MKVPHYFVISCLMMLVSCKNEQAFKMEIGGTFDHEVKEVSIEGEQFLFTLLGPDVTGIDFVNNIFEDPNVNYFTYAYIFNGAGIAVGDINNDGLPDLYFSGNMVPNRLYLNMGNFKFKDITATSGTDGGQGFSTGVTMVDINNDGLLDIYVCKAGPYVPELRKNMLYINNGDLTFTEKAADYGLDDASFSTQAYFFDIDNDGDLDMYLVNHPLNPRESNVLNARINEMGELEVAISDDLTHISDRLYLNENGKFIDISEKAGILNEAFGLSAIVADFNNDQKFDILICNDYVKPDYLYINNGNNTFTERFSDFMSQSAFSAMGSDYADYNNDGCPDLLVLDMLPPDDYRRKMLGLDLTYDKYQLMLRAGFAPQFTKNALQLNNCNGSFSEIAFMAGVDATDWSWTALFADLDNNGWKDLFVSNGYMREVSNIDYITYHADSLLKLFRTGKITMDEWMAQVPVKKTRNHLFKNNMDFTFSDVSGIWDAGPDSYSNGAVYADLDGDGYLDLIVNNLREPAFVMKNEGKQLRKNNFIRFNLEDNTRKSTYGALLRLYYPDGEFQLQQFYPTRGYMSSVEPTVHFGLGSGSDPDRLEIIWPDGTVQIVKDLVVNRTHTITKEKTGLVYKPTPPANLYFEEIIFSKGDRLSHEENPYIDFKREPLLYRKLSEEGPAVAIADVNGDGLDDIYVGGSVGFSGSIYLQQKDGSFSKTDNLAFRADMESEDVAAVFFDANSNGYPDLYVVSGGNEYPENAPFYFDRLYFNDGKGNFKRDESALPKIPTSGSCVKVHDINGDGLPDLFVGGRSTPGVYPQSPISMILINEGGKFSLKTKEYGPELHRAGMITDAVFADLDKDGKKELIICGEWLPVSVFKLNEEGQYKNITTSLGLDKLTGWWYTVTVEDLNGDGYPELIAGNLGLNNLLNVRGNKPVRLYAKDFDGNGSMDAVLTYYNGEKSYPVAYRDKMLDQMIFLKKKFLTYHSYAMAGLEDIFTPDQLKDARILEANNMSHLVYENIQGKEFKARSLPLYTQISTVRSIVVTDVNQDNIPDIIIGGNDFGTDIEIGPFDASVGAVLLGDGKFGFKVIRPGDSGFFIPGNVRKILPYQSGRGLHYVVSRNNDRFSFFKNKKSPI